MRLPRFLLPLAIRPNLVIGLAMMGAIYLCAFDLKTPTRLIVAWDVGVATFLGLTLSLMARRTSAEKIAQRAEETDQGRWAVLALSVIASALTICALLYELARAKDSPPDQMALRLALTAVTIALSWTFVHVVFCLHYAHEFYGRVDPADQEADLVVEGGAQKKARQTRRRRGGLKFPGEDDTPDFQDFLHFALVIGVANQTADVQITSKAVRRLVTLHGTVAFVFNTVILALAINAAGALFSA